ncbi:hypothetical protein CLV24_12864 [Pontibacter ummariensis]|uniref:TTHB210-like domain-containing protein n=1 Tax=Pontibacter ummariensis TaxID=1610492 RepID=A0A239KBX6_9BACT|nr:DUF5602 domain-containing protein [Pontibacter ummariensis]PRY06082.1 hypothetical protein CLV24_12864 [Pontibacter ummariensis]SNT15119.1 hypothetical protein SAMN06296052_12764 [Pontibacter ummariensis]
MMKKNILQRAKALPLPLYLLGVMLVSGCSEQEVVEPAVLQASSLHEAKGKGQNESIKTQTFYGPATPLGQGVARTWVEVNKNGEPVAIGVNMSSKAAASLPDEMTIYNLQLPKQVEATPFQTVMLDWNPAGHGPNMYEKPHFDVHFYMISNEERAAIPGGEQTLSEDFQANYIPKDHLFGGMSIPGMGVHWINSHSPEIMHEEEFTKTFIFGEYQNKVIFYEPMLTLEYLQGLAPNIVEEAIVPQPAKVQQSGYYPKSYTVSYDPTPGEYTIALTNLYYRVAE